MFQISGILILKINILVPRQSCNKDKFLLKMRMRKRKMKSRVKSKNYNFFKKVDIKDFKYIKNKHIKNIDYIKNIYFFKILSLIKNRSLDSFC
jgi:hypothetical protein